MNFLRRHTSKVLTWVGIAAPVIGGLLSGGIYTAASIGAAIGLVAMKYAASPVSHDEERSRDLAERIAKGGRQ